MGVLTRNELLRRILNEYLIKSPNRDPNNNIILEGASYDLCVGTIIWKDSDSKDTKILHYNPITTLDRQEQTTLHPGQMLLVVTKEDINMPLDLSATVYSRNKLAREGILALNAGHIDPGYEGPIIIRLINLRAIPYTLRLGAPIYTIVFQKLDSPISSNMKHPAVSRDESITKATNSVNEALGNALYDLALLGSFVKKDEFGKLFWGWVWANIVKAFFILIAIVVFAAGVISAIPALIDLIKNHTR